MLKSVEKQTDPTITLWPQTFLRQDPCKRASIVGALFLLSHRGGSCHRTVLFRSLGVQIPRGFLSEPRETTRVPVRTAGPDTALSTHLTVFLLLAARGNPDPSMVLRKVPGKTSLESAALAQSFLFLMSQ